MATKSSALTKTSLDSLKKTHLEHQKLIQKSKTELNKSEQKVRDRISYIIDEYYKLWNATIDNWDFGDNNDCGNCYGDGCDKCKDASIWDYTDKSNIFGLCIEARYDDEIDMPIEDMGGEAFIIIDKNGKEYSMLEYDATIPLRWLFEDFIPEITEGKKKYEEKLKKSMTKSQKDQLAKKHKEAEMLSHLKKRLTKEEIAVIRANLYKL